MAAATSLNIPLERLGVGLGLVFFCFKADYGLKYLDNPWQNSLLLAGNFPASRLI